MERNSTGVTMRADTSVLLDGGELTAGPVDVAAAGVADRRRDALGLEPADELALVVRVRRGPHRTRSRIQRDEVHMDPATALRAAARQQLLAEHVRSPRLVVDAAHHGVLDR